MKKFTSLIAALALVLCAFVFSTSAKTDDVSFDKPAASFTFIVNDKPEIQAQTEISPVQIAYTDDGDGLTALRSKSPSIISKRGVIPIATVQRIEPYFDRKTETRKSVSNFTEAKFYDLPPNDDAYRGESFTNRIRDIPVEVS